ncbi:30S ribosomal protein S27e [Nitrosopumilus sp. K4]|uniref:30S ribosomal protein S27e n=1 Tax=Nitrosopumilus sp. K4 TaxID=2795383 RepID=UPI001BA7C465|nr:30S ribosomal protein S27e [Nitrosopumilus sp. K4]QUC64439.1 30S ribosomal protein S27e [Nitrosopumilus sp. K4]
MKKDHIEIPKPTSKFQKVNCNECGELQIVYSHASQPVACNSCGNNIAEPTGSKAKINGKISGSAE